MQNEGPITIIIAGDIYPSGTCENALIKRETTSVFHDLLPQFQNADYVVANLECPLTLAETPIQKDGANLKANPETIFGLKKAGINAFGLANNHIMDHGEQGLSETIETLDREEISYFGAGTNAESASQPLIVNIKNKTFGFLAIAEHEFSIATSNTMGAYGLNVPDNCRAIKSLKGSVDFLIVLYHGGKEHYPYPTPNQQNIFRYFIEEGADAVIAQHSHIIGGHEFYEGKFIQYGQGNFLFEKQSRDYKSWFEGVLIKLSFIGADLSVEFIPFEQSNGFVGVKKTTGDKKSEILQRMEEYSKIIVNSENVLNKWESLCEKELNLYQSRLLGHNRYVRYLNKKLKFANWWYPNWKRNMIRNVVECETHREGLETLWRSKRQNI